MRSIIHLPTPHFLPHLDMFSRLYTHIQLLFPAYRRVKVPSYTSQIQLGHLEISIRYLSKHFFKFHFGRIRYNLPFLFLLILIFVIFMPNWQLKCSPCACSLFCFFASNDYHPSSNCCLLRLFVFFYFFYHFCSSLISLSISSKVICAYFNSLSVFSFGLHISFSIELNFPFIC